MGRTRRARRKSERARAKRVPTTHGLSPGTRLLVALVSIGAIVAGGFLLVSGTPQTEHRLARVAGILILIGLVGVVVALIGRT